MTDWNNGWRTCCCSKDTHGLFLCRPDLDLPDSSRRVAVHPPPHHIWWWADPPPTAPWRLWLFAPQVMKMQCAVIRPSWTSPFSEHTKAGWWWGAWPWRGGKEEARQCRPVHRRGERVVVSRCWPTLSDNCFLVCGSAWRDARRQEPSSAGCIPAGSRERAQPGRRVLLDQFYMGPSSGRMHL